VHPYPLCFPHGMTNNNYSVCLKLCEKLKPRDKPFGKFLEHFYINRQLTWKGSTYFVVRLALSGKNVFLSYTGKSFLTHLFAQSLPFYILEDIWQLRISS
jgi:hypothetical protein